jgi:hypothetical protein
LRPLEVVLVAALIFVLVLVAVALFWILTSA